jgi:hypothetical protein
MCIMLTLCYNKQGISQEATSDIYRAYSNWHKPKYVGSDNSEKSQQLREGNYRLSLFLFKCLGTTTYILVACIAIIWYIPVYQFDP